MYAFEYAEKNPQELEKDYPYAGMTQDCKTNKEEEVVKATTFAHVPKMSSQQLKAAIAVQPTSVSVDASGWGW